MYHKEVFSLKILFALSLSLFTLSAFGEIEIDLGLLQGKWQCVQEFNLTDSVHFRSSQTSRYSLANGEVVSSGIITTSLLQDPDTKSVLQTTYLSRFSIEGTTITFTPYDIKGTVLENGLGDLTEEFVRGFEEHKVDSMADIALIDEVNLQLNYHTGTSAKCLRK